MVREAEEEHAADGVVLVLRGEDALDDVAAAARLRAGLAHRPPVHREWHDEYRHERVHVGELREEVERPLCLQLCHQPRHAPHLRLPKRVDCRNYRADHDDREEVEVRVDHAAHAAERGIDDARDGRHEDDGRRRYAEEDDADLHAGHHHRSKDEQIEHEPEVHGAQRPQERRRLAGVAQLVEFHVRRHAAPVPELRVHEHRHEARQQKRPPGPVAAHAVLADDLREEVRAVRGRGGGHHRDADEPPRHGASGQEELLRAGGTFARRPRRNREKDREEDGDDDPVKSCHVVRLT